MRGLDSDKAHRMRILIFGKAPSDLHTMADALRPFADVTEISWQTKSFVTSPRNLLPKAFYRLIETGHECLSIFRAVRIFKADLVLAQYVFHFGLIGAISAKLARRTCVIQAIGSDLKLDPLNRNRRTIISMALNIASGVICVSKDIENIAKTLGSRNTVVIPFPLDLTDFQEGLEPKKENQIVSVMKLSPIKGIPYLITAMTLIKKGELLIIGTGSEKEKSESLVRELGLQDRVFLLGWVDRKGMWSYLEQSTVFVLPSLSEGTPRVILEAMMCGLPVVATRVGGIPEMIEDGVNGVLVPPRNEKALAEGISRILDDPDFQRKVSMNNRVKVKSFGINVIGPRLFDYLRNFVNR